jgi:hypothetical protein
MDNLTEIQKQMLKNLLEQDAECYYSYAWFDEGIGGKGEMKKEIMKKEMVGLRKLGLVDFQRGLMNDDGEVCGSGFQIFYEKRQAVAELLGVEQ